MLISLFPTRHRQYSPMKQPMKCQWTIHLLQQKINISRADSQLSVHGPSNKHIFLKPLDKLKKRLTYSHEYSVREFPKEYSFLEHMGVIVPLNHPKVAGYSRTGTFEYIPLHFRDPSLLSVDTPSDLGLLSPESPDLHHLPHHSKKGISYEEGDLMEFHPEVSHTASL